VAEVAVGLVKLQVAEVEVAVEAQEPPPWASGRRLL